LSNHLGTLYIVATPIGNLEDLSSRARRILFEVPFIAAEDTRETLKLLNLVRAVPETHDTQPSGLRLNFPRLVSYHEHNEEQRAQELIELLKGGNSVALVSDAGTPAISDPGYRLVSLAHLNRIPVVPIPGPCAVTTLLCASGLPTNRFMFVGFLPQKSQARDAEITSWKATDRGITIVFYESTRRLERTFEALARIHPNAHLTVGRELTKFHEEIVRFPIGEAQLWLNSHPTLKGEVAVVFHLPPESFASANLEDQQNKEQLISQAQEEFKRGESLKTILQKYRNIGIRRSDLYALLLEAKNKR
jgi:16S rRNA (cytidine1402-2'-O)-methyltransferase